MAKAKKSVKKKAKAGNEHFQNLAYALFAVAMAYAFASWAIDSGSLWMYLFAYISIYFAVSYTNRFIRAKFFNNDKSRKASKSKKKTRR